MDKNKIIKLVKELLKILIAISIGLPMYHIARIFDLRIVFLFHQISDKPDYFSKAGNLNIKPKRFTKIIEIIIKYFEVVDDYKFFNQNLKKFRNKPLALITFDDGYFEAIEESYKISLKYNFPIFHFINTEYIEYPKKYTSKYSPAMEYIKCIENKKYKKENVTQTIKKINYLKGESKYPKRSSISFIKSLKNNKLIFCSHGHNHIKYFDRHNSDNIYKDFFKSKKIIEKNKFNNSYFAFPFGKVDKKIYGFLRKISKNKVYFFLGMGAFNNPKTMRNRRLVKRVNITEYEKSLIRILYRISISIALSTIPKIKNFFTDEKIYH